MIKKIVLSLVIIIAILFLNDITIAQNIKEGLWEITVKMEMEEGMPVKTPPQTIRQCIKKEDPVPKIEEADKNCKFISKQIKGDTVSWKAECKDKEGATTMTGKVTYRGTTFDGIVEVMEDGDLIMKAKISGKWIGECQTRRR